MNEDKIIQAYTNKNYKLEENIPNIFAVRNTKVHTDIYPHDYFGVLYKEKEEWKTIITSGYTQIIPFLKKNAISNLGIVSLIPGQYLEIYRIGYHKLPFELLRQVRDMTYLIETSIDSRVITENKYSNIHRVNTHQLGANLIRYNNGGQFIINSIDYNKIDEIIKKAAYKDNEILFNYTLFKDVNL